MMTEHRRPRAGLLPLYLELYDRLRPGIREQFEPLLAGVTNRLEHRGIDVTRGEVCRLTHEFEAALARFEDADVDCIVTLHLAYSPSLESVDLLSRSKLPIVILDTTMDADFGQGVDPKRILFNHGIHGVQDMANLLRRRRKGFEIVAGHVANDGMMDRAADLVRATRAARRFGGLKVVRIGEAFAGMGDFSVPPDLLERRFHIRLESRTLADLADVTAQVGDDRIEAEIDADRERFDCRAPMDVHRPSVRLGLGMRDLLARCGCDAFSANFQVFDTPDEPICTVPFLEISKAMARGFGYAGEGDILTASLLGAVLSAWPDSTFTEIFCPDWAGETLFLSHMGEVNPRVLEGRPVLLEKDYAFSEARNPAFLTGPWKTGPATLVNLAPGPEASFTLVVAPLEILPDGTHPDMASVIRAWARPGRSLPDFLERYSRAGGTHHSVLILGKRVEAVQAMGRLVGIDSLVIQ